MRVRRWWWRWGVVVADGIHYIQVEVGVHMNFAAVGNWGMANIAQIEMRVDTWGIAVGRMDEAHIEVPPTIPRAHNISPPSFP